jgi:hypothetical protein
MGRIVARLRRSAFSGQHSQPLPFGSAQGRRAGLTYDGPTALGATARKAGDVNSPLRGTRGIGVEAFLVKEEDAGAKGEEHDGEAGGDAETGDDGCGTFAAAADDNVAGYGDQEFEDTPFEQPGDEAVDGGGRISKVRVEENSPEHPQAGAEAQDNSIRGEVGPTPTGADYREAERPHSRRGEEGHQNSGDRAGNKNVRPGLEAFEESVDRDEKQKDLTAEKDRKWNPDNRRLGCLAEVSPEVGATGVRVGEN